MIFLIVYFASIIGVLLFNDSDSHTKWWFISIIPVLNTGISVHFIWEFLHEEL